MMTSKRLGPAAIEYTRLYKAKFPLCEHQAIQSRMFHPRLIWFFGWRVWGRVEDLPCDCPEFMEASR